MLLSALNRFVRSNRLPVGGVVDRVTTHGEALESRLLTGDGFRKHLVVGVGEVHEGDVVSSSHVVGRFRVVEAGGVILGIGSVVEGRDVLDRLMDGLESRVSRHMVLLHGHLSSKFNK